MNSNSVMAATMRVSIVFDCQSGSDLEFFAPARVQAAHQEKSDDYRNKNEVIHNVRSSSCSEPTPAPRRRVIKSQALLIKNSSKWLALSPVRAASSSRFSPSPPLDGGEGWERRHWKLPRGLPKQVVLALGYSGVADWREQGHGAFARVIVPWPQVNLDVCLTVGGRYYSGSGLMDGWGDYESVRFEWGMHLASLFVGAGHDRYPTEKTTGHGLMFEAGLTFTFPVSRWKQTLSFSN
jgi:hypothetical protein